LTFIACAIANQTPPARTRARRETDTIRFGREQVVGSKNRHCEKSFCDDHVLFYRWLGDEPNREIDMKMKPWTIAVTAAVLLAAAWWHWPAAAQRAAQPATSESITFDQYRDFRLRDLARRQVRLAQQLVAPGLSEAEKASLERRKAYYDQLAAMSAEDRDRLYRERFDQIDVDHDGKLDPQERAAWREKQRENYRRQAAERARASDGQH
jgi:hypothetical protein